MSWRAGNRPSLAGLTESDDDRLRTAVAVIRSAVSSEAGTRGKRIPPWVVYIGACFEHAASTNLRHGPPIPRPGYGWPMRW